MDWLPCGILSAEIVRIPHNKVCGTVHRGEFEHVAPEHHNFVNVSLAHPEAKGI